MKNQFDAKVNYIDNSQIRQLTIPTPYAVGPVNIFAIKGSEGYYLIDAGINNKEARKLIREWLPSPLAGILISHGHTDHLGLAGEIARAKGCPVYLFAEEYKRLQEPDLQTTRISQLLGVGGVPPQLLNGIKELYQKSRQNYIVQLVGAEVKELTPGQKFSTELGNLEVIHTPGHTIGHCCFYLAEKKWLFSGDHILANISPNPILDVDRVGQRRLALVEYLQSLEKTASLSVDRVYPGHGQPFTKLDRVIEQFYTYHKKREAIILSTFSHQQQTPFQITQKVYPGVKGMDAFLAISKVWGHLDILDLEGKVNFQIKDDTLYYCLR